MKNIIDIKDLSLEEINELIEIARDIMENKEKYLSKCKNKILATLFFEPSTRTRLSFESAMISLGGSVIGFSESSSSSTAKGESLSDTIRTVACYSDVIAMRHPKEGAPFLATKKSTVPIINAGDGGHNHPTQTLTDLLTIKIEKNRLDNLTIGLCGDLKFGRTVHSLIIAMSRYVNIKFILISPHELKIPQYLKDEIQKNRNIQFCELENIEDCIEELDVLYMTRIQKERFSKEEDYLRLKDCYILDNNKLLKAKKDLCIMHPLPRVNEISVEVDDDPRASYFKQVLNGKYIRMALILKVLENEKKENEKKESKKKNENSQEISGKYKCTNNRCITTVESTINQEFEKIEGESEKYKCKYCENHIKI